MGRQEPDAIRALEEALARNWHGTAPQYRYADGGLTRTDEVLGGLALGPGKPEHIFAHTGRMPVLACGNADVDIEILEVELALLVVHDDDEREYAYTAAAEESVTTAAQQGWTTVSMKNDWRVVFE